ncbi:MAG: nitronate monooxygenase, partial [Acidimicrobiales bacterium]
MTHPRIIQGGMGIGVSDWRLAGAVGRAGGLGVVSGVALDSMLCRRLQDGDRDGQLRQALAQFPAPQIADKVLDRYFIRGGRPAGQPYRLAPRLSLEPSLDRLRLAVVAAFAEVHLAKQAAHGAPVGINFLEKIQLATPAAAYGALLAEVDFVLVGAGIPARLPALLDDLARQREVDFPIDVAGAGSTRHSLSFDPVATLGRAPGGLVRPLFLAIVSSNTLATYLARDDETRPDGFVVEGEIAGGHNAPPRGALRLDRSGDPVYGPRDLTDTAQFSSLGLPFWLAGGYSRPDRVAA